MADEKRPQQTTQQPAPAQADRIAVLEAQIANLQKLLAAQQPLLTPLQEEEVREKFHDAKVKELSLSCQERTQKKAREMWKDPTEYPVRVADIPEILIPARNEIEAQGRYNHLCGINGVDAAHRYIVGKPVQNAAS